MIGKITIGSDLLVTLTGLTDEDTGSLINNATVTVTVYNEAGVEVTGETWPVSLSYVAASDGIYTATLTSALVLSEQVRYLAKITAVKDLIDKTFNQYFRGVS